MREYSEDEMERVIRETASLKGIQINGDHHKMICFFAAPVMLEQVMAENRRLKSQIGESA